MADRSHLAGAHVVRGGVENVAAVLSGHWPQPDRIVNKEVAPWFPLQDYNPALFGV